MAENWTILKSVRLKLRDPAGYISIQTVANPEALPATPIAQTAYRVESLGQYQARDGITWKRVDLRIDDEMLNSLIESYGENGAISRAISQIIASLYSEIQMVRHDSGSESMQFQTLTDILNYYKALKKAYEDEAASEVQADTGRIIKTRRPIIGGVWE